MGKTIQVTRSQAESARLLMETADKWGQPVPDGVRAVARAGEANLNVHASLTADGVVSRSNGDPEVEAVARHTSQLREELIRLIERGEAVPVGLAQQGAEVIDMLAYLQSSVERMQIAGAPAAEPVVNVDESDDGRGEASSTGSLEERRAIT